MSQKRKRHALPSESSRTAERKTRSIRIVAQNKRARNIPVSQLSERSYQSRDNALHALTLMRRGMSFSEAAHLSGVTPRTLKKFVGSALLQDRNGGRIRASKGDSFVRFLTIPGPHGQIEVVARGSKEATELAKYASAVGKYLSGRDTKALAPFHGKKISGVELLTAGRSLKALADVGALPTSLYRAFAAGAA